ncbi:hypothetical protein [Phaeobacter inhibens]|uniref:hypothetical protein n=1 Tax=Phaeobacter inhibens TaxID=221822 RepID=UPI0021A2C939|nr:hypothetical protein [Phaeobacter inhibens]UWR59231.1 hypothetical protein K4F88_09745 [Phaeobacter inhibens]
MLRKRSQNWFEEDTTLAQAAELASWHASTSAYPSAKRNGTDLTDAPRSTLLLSFTADFAEPNGLDLFSELLSSSCGNTTLGRVTCLMDLLMSKAKGIMFVSKPRGAKDDEVRTASSREEAQALAKTSTLIVANKSKFLPRSGVSVRSRPYVAFDFEGTTLEITMQWRSETATLVFNLEFDGPKCRVSEPRFRADRKELSPKKRAELTGVLDRAITSLALLDFADPLVANNVAVLQNAREPLCDLTRKALDKSQIPIEELKVKTAALQKALDQVPTGAFVVHCWSGRGMIAIHEGLEPLKHGQTIFALTPKHAQLLAQALGEGSAHARLAAMRLLEKVSENHPAALPDEVHEKLYQITTDGNVLARLETLNDMAEEETLGEVHLVDPRMINTYSSYRLPYGYNYERSWQEAAAREPLRLERKRSSLPLRPRADLVSLDGVLCVSDTAKAVLEGLNIGSSKFHFIEGTDDYWAMEITETKSGPIPDESLYERNRSGVRTPRNIEGKALNLYTDLLAKRARFGPEDLQGADIWKCEDLNTSSRSQPLVVVSEAAVTALKKAKCKWYKPVHAARVVD